MAKAHIIAAAAITLLLALGLFLVDSMRRGILDSSREYMGPQAYAAMAGGLPYINVVFALLFLFVAAFVVIGLLKRK